MPKKPVVSIKLTNDDLMLSEQDVLKLQAISQEQKKALIKFFQLETWAGNGKEERQLIADIAIRLYKIMNKRSGTKVYVPQNTALGFSVAPNSNSDAVAQ